MGGALLLGRSESRKKTYALPRWDAAAERHDAQDELHSAAQAMAWADGDFDADHGFGLGGVGRSGY